MNAELLERTGTAIEALGKRTAEIAAENPRPLLLIGLVIAGGLCAIGGFIAGTAKSVTVEHSNRDSKTTLKFEK